jgi:hypothetical protein
VWSRRQEGHLHHIGGEQIFHRVCLAEVRHEIEGLLVERQDARREDLVIRALSKRVWNNIDTAFKRIYAFLIKRVRLTLQ